MLLKYQFCGYSSHETLNLSILRKQYEQAGLQLDIFGNTNALPIGWNQKSLKNQNFGLKMLYFQRYLEDIVDPYHTIVVMTDLFDVRFYGTLTELDTKFQDFHALAVFSAEWNCQPDPSLSIFYPSSPTRARFLNSGTFMGYAHYLLKCLRKYPFDRETDDQRYWTDVFFKENRRNPNDFRLDYYSHIFFCSALRITHVKRSSFPDTDGKHRLYDADTGNTFNFLHNNGSAFLTATFDDLLHTGDKTDVRHLTWMERSWRWLVFFRNFKGTILMILLVIAFLCALKIYEISKSRELIEMALEQCRKEKGRRITSPRE